jgi:hypothetical protein
MNSSCPYNKSLSADAVDAGPIPRGYSASQLQDLKRDLDALAPAMAWVDDFVTRSHADLGRTGMVCPYVPEALRRDLLDFFVLPVELAAGSGRERGDDDYIAALEPLILRIRDRFVATQSTDPRFRLLHSYLMVFRGLPSDADRAALLIETIQKRLKPKFVELGLMIGEFHPISNAIGLRNPDFRPLRSPVPLLSIRNMVEVDFAFLNRTYDPAPVRVRFLRSYLRYVGHELGHSSRSKVETALQEAEEEALQTA